MPCTTSKKRGQEGYSGRLVLDAGIEYLARPASPPSPPKHCALTRFMQRIFGKDCKHIQKGENNKRACKKAEKKKSSRDHTKGKDDKSKQNRKGFAKDQEPSCSVSTSQVDVKFCDKKKAKGHRQDKKCLPPTCQPLINKELCDGQCKVRKAQDTRKLLSNEHRCQLDTVRSRYKFASTSPDPFRMSEISLDVGYLPEIYSSTALTTSHTCEGSCKTPLTRRRVAAALSGSCIQDTTTSGTSYTGTTSLLTYGGSLDTGLERWMGTERDDASEGATICRGNDLVESVNWYREDRQSEDPKHCESDPVMIDQTFKLESTDIMDLDSVVLQDSGLNISTS